MAFDIRSIRFGFEYETLVEPINKDYYNTYKRFIENGAICEKDDNQLKTLADELDNVKKIRLTAAYISELESQIKDLSILKKSANDRVYLAAMYNAILSNIYPQPPFKTTQFIALQSEVQTPCETQLQMSFNPITFTRLEDISRVSKKWLVTGDTSVKTNDQFALYETYETYDPSRPRIFNNDDIINCIEIISPILSYDDVYGPYFTTILDNLLPVQNALKYWNNDLTSNHVHISSTSPLFDKEKHVFLIKLIMAWWYFEPLILILHGSWRRNNLYCVPLRNIIHDMFKDDPEIVNDLFFTLNEAKIETILGTTDSDILVYALIQMFQGELTSRNTRFAAFNMMNLVLNGINTVEFRIKEGSSSGKENQYFMIFLAEFINYVMNNATVTALSDKIKNTLFNMKLIAVDEESVGFYEKDETGVKECFELLMGFIPDDTVKAYYRKLFTKNCIFMKNLRGGKNGGASRYDGGGRERSEITSFGEIDFAKFNDMMQNKKYIEAGQRIKKYLADRRKLKKHSFMAGLKTYMMKSVSAY